MVFVSVTRKLLGIYNNDACDFACANEKQRTRPKTKMIGASRKASFKESRIDKEQAETVEEHFNWIMADDTLINSEHVNVSPDDFPDWFDEKYFKLGQQYYMNNVLGLNAAYLTGLFAVFVIPSISQFLKKTNQSSTPCSAFRRYMQTLLHLYNIHIHDCRNSDSKFYKSLNTIRWKHSMSSKCILKRSGQGITQKEMVLVQFAFIGYVLLNPDMMALTDRPEEREAMNHFWRVVGHLLGIPDRLNVCRKNEKETMELCRIIRDEVYTKYLQAPDDNFLHLATVALNGLQCVDVMLDMDAFLAFFYESHGLEYTKQMGLYSKFNYLYRKWMFSIMTMPIIGTVVRNFWNYYFFTIYWIQEKYPFVAWMKYGKDQSKITLFPTLTSK